MGTQPNDPMYGYGPGPYPPPMQDNQGRGLALGGLIVGIVALVLCWVPVIGLVLSLVGLGLAIAALVIAVRRRTSAKGLAIAGTVVSGVALIAAIVVAAFLSAVITSISDSIESASPSASGTNPATSTPSTGTGSASATATAAELLPIGTAAEVGEYTVTVSSVQLDATAAILGFSELNQPPDGQYVLVTLDVVYNGNEESDPWLDLTANFVGSDSRQYDESTCSAVLDLEGTSVPTLENGGAAQYEVCMDVPAAALPGQRVLVEETFGLTRPLEASWRTE